MAHLTFSLFSLPHFFFSLCHGLSVFLFVFLSVYLCVFLSFYLSFSFPFSLSFCPSLCAVLSIFFFVFPSVFSLSLSPFHSLSVSVSLFSHLNQDYISLYYISLSLYLSVIYSFSLAIFSSLPPLSLFL